MSGTDQKKAAEGHGLRAARHATRLDPPQGAKLGSKVDFMLNEVVGLGVGFYRTLCAL